MTEEKIQSLPGPIILELGVKERIQIPSILPTRGGMLDMKIAQEVIRKTELSIGEMAKLNMAQSTSSQGQPIITWNDDGAKAIGKKRIELSKIEVGVMKKHIEGMDERKEIPLDLLPLAIMIDDLKTGD